jgi:hypothetical protein
MKGEQWVHGHLGVTWNTTGFIPNAPLVQLDTNVYERIKALYQKFTKSFYNQTISMFVTIESYFLFHPSCLHSTLQN